MNIPEEFGKYLLLKKLTEDPLGETFRAGRAGTEGMEQIILLRVFNGKGLDGEKLWAKVSGRGGVQEILRSPNIGNGVDLGRVRSFPYTAYDYISGKSLATLFAQSARQRSPIPTDHALLIAERISLALAAAYESRLQDERVLHGFVVPHLVMISNEGETRLLGFEVAPGLRELAAGGWQDEALRPYLSPETLAGAPLGRADDVYSLGALLFTLLTGERLPAAPADGYAALIDAATLPSEGTPLPEPVAALLKKSLVPREQRIADAAAWHKTLAKLMSDGSFSPTTFNLAFFMHNLFREEIERESQEMQAEKKLELPQRQAAPPPVAAAPIATMGTTAAMAAMQDPREATGAGVREGTGTWSGTRAHSPQAAAPSKKPLWIGLAAAGLIVLAGGGYFLFGRSGGDAQAAAPRPPAVSPTVQTAAMPGTMPPVATPATGPGTPGTAGAAAGPTPDELQAQIQKMFEARSKQMEDKLKGQYDDRIKQLQQQLSESRKSPSGESERAKPERTAEKAEPPSPVETHTAQKPEPAAPAPQTAIPQPGASAVPSPGGAANAAGERAAQGSPVPQPAAPKSQVQVGDLVQPGPGVAAPKLTSRLDPRYPAAAQRLNRAAQVDIKVLVDEHGRVLDADRIGTKAGFGFDEAALDAAKRAVFQPATRDGVRVKMWTTLRVNFKGM
jgi:TonB family protein